MRLTPVSPVNIDRLGALDRARLGAEILIAYLRVRWLLHSQTPIDAVASLRRHARGHQIRLPPGTDLLVGWRLAHAVSVTLSPLPTDVRCLFRSLTLLALMERRSLHPKLIISARPQPFVAHAWIELYGQALLPDADDDHQRLVEL
jgi:hypothetical protein